MKRLPFVLLLALGTVACGSKVQSIRKPPSAMVIVFVTLAAGGMLARRDPDWGEPG